MHVLRLVVRWVCELPRSWTTTLILGSYGLCLLLLLVGFPSPLNGSLFFIPTALIAWFYRVRGVLLFTGVLLLTFAGVNTLQVGLWWSRPILGAYLTGSGGLLAIGLVIGALRTALDMSEAARTQASLAEERLGRAYEQEQQLRQRKDAFLVHVNHELRTPLTTVSGYLELLQDHDLELDPQTRSLFVKQALEGCRELQTLVGTIIEVAQIENGDLVLEPCALVVVQEVAEVVQYLHLSQQGVGPITLDISRDVTVWADQRSMQLVLRHLLSNAFTYAKSPSPVLVSARQEEAETEKMSSSHVRICIKDDGDGIAPEDLPLLFGKYVRLQKALSGTVRGIGLGLYLCKRLVEAMGGTMWAESSGKPGEGCAFYMRLPVATLSE